MARTLAQLPVLQVAAGEYVELGGCSRQTRRPNRLNLGASVAAGSSSSSGHGLQSLTGVRRAGAVDALTLRSGRDFQSSASTAVVCRASSGRVDVVAEFVEKATEFIISPEAQHDVHTAKSFTSGPKLSSSADDQEGEGWSLGSVASSMQKCIFYAALAAAVALPLEVPSSDVFAATLNGPVVSELAGLIAGPPVKDPDALLRYALPISNKPIKDVQRSLEEITDILKVPGAKAIDPVERAVRQASRQLNQNKDAILVDVAEAKKEEAQQLLGKLSEGLLDFQRLLETKERAAIAPKQQELLNIVGDVEEAMVGKFPYDVPSEYASKPLLKGRASVEMKVKVKDNPNIRDAVFEITVDGYNAPVTAGNFIDLVVRRFYDGMEIQRADGFVVQTGDPDGPADGFVDPSTGKIRTIPLEIMVDGDDRPIYGATLEELGRFREQTKLPFNAFGTMAMAREEFEPDTASSQIFWLLKESELTPSSANILDGTFAVFGYVTRNGELFADLKVGDVIESIKVTHGLDNLVNPSYTIGGA